MKFNKEKGFTLIELLAVIVVLAIILLIATPIILNVIEDARKGAFKSSAGMLIKTAENKYLENALNNNRENLVITYVNGELTSSTDLNYRGERPKNGTIVVREDGKVGIAIDNGKWCALKNYNEEIINLIKLENDNCKLSEVPNIITKDTSGANAPKLAEGMTPVAWDDNNNEYTPTNIDDPDNQNWYNYSNKKWANAKTVDGSYWVWIPRYAYKITSGYHSNTAGEIDVKFLKGTTLETTDSILVETTGYDAGIKDTSTNYFLHPSFQFDGEALGFWVAKYEPSIADQTNECYTNSSNCDNVELKLKIIPNAKSWRYITIGNSYIVSKNMKNDTSIYGWYPNEVDTHMMKNSEWGAVTYLSKSKYGAHTEEVWNNTYNQYKTGCSGTHVSASMESTCVEYNTVNGVKASTTHNIYGVYDMSGGSLEYVSAYVNNGNENLSYGSSLVSETDLKYKNIYEVGNPDDRLNNYEKNKNIYGDAVYETSANGNTANSSWYGDYSYMPNSSYPFFHRGGDYVNGSVVGIFAFDQQNGCYFGSPCSSTTFRPVFFVK